MYKTSLSVKKLNLDIDDEIIFKSLSLELKCGSINFIINDEVKSLLLFKSILNLVDSKSKTTLYSNKITDSFEEIGYYSPDIDIYKDLTVKRFFELSASYYKNNYDKYLKELIDLFHINLKDKIESLDRNKYELIKLIDCLYHLPSLLVFYEPYRYLEDYQIEIFNNYLTKLKENGTTILIYTKKLYNLYSSDNNYFIFSKYQLVNITSLKDKKFYIIYKGELITKLKILTIFGENTNKFTYIGPLSPLVFDLIKSKVEVINIKEAEDESII